MHSAASDLKEAAGPPTAAADEMDVCAICYADKMEMPYRLVNCSHVFCKTCLMEKRRVTGDPRCPQCRRISFIAVSTMGFGHVDLGHSPDAKRVEDLRIPKEDIAQAMVCMHCLRRDFVEYLIQCNTCMGVSHTTCAGELIPDLTSETGKPVDWTCATCTAKQRSAQGVEAMRALFAESARARRGDTAPRERSVPGNRSKKRRASTNDGGGRGGGGGSGGAGHRPRSSRSAEVDTGLMGAFSGHHLGNRHSSSRGRAFFQAKRSKPKRPRDLRAAQHGDEENGSDANESNSDSGTGASADDDLSASDHDPDADDCADDTPDEL